MGQGLGNAGSTIVEFFSLFLLCKTEQMQEFLSGEKGTFAVLVTREVQCKDRLMVLAANNNTVCLKQDKVFLHKVCKHSTY